ncbi:MAG: hypothetical protein AAEC10_02675 [Rhodospirillales bacterium]
MPRGERGARRVAETSTRDLMFAPGKAAIERRLRAYALMDEDSSRDTDLFALGPETPCDDQFLARFYGEL